MFILNKRTKVEVSDKKLLTIPVANAVGMIERDREKVFINSNMVDNKIVLEYESIVEEESYILEIDTKIIKIKASDDLGFIYALLYISEKYMEIKPFWFWMDQDIIRKDNVEIEEGTVLSRKPVVRFRGWFFNDEVLMMKWKYNDDSDEGWKMCFEALLRCGGNITIPGTDKMSRKNRKLATDMGLWITHHHAEPLGAEMFGRRFPELEPNYLVNKSVFEMLWEEAVLEQKDSKVVWNLCFRGQGDMPFWSHDNEGQFDTPKKRGKMISEVINTQARIVRKYVDNPVFCTNLYGEIMELYQLGYIDLDDDIIKVRADNGYGKMVSRRQDNHNPRIDSMPDKKDNNPQGIYYHVSFYDLQAANHITMLQNSVGFVKNELSKVLENGGNAFWIINCSNVRPHTYHLDAIRKLWYGEQIDDEKHSREFSLDYFDGNTLVSSCYKNYASAMMSFGIHEDEHIGEQFYTENLRIIVNRMLVAPEEPAKALYWIAGKKTLSEQTRHICNICKNGIGKLERFYNICEQVDNNIFNSTLFHNTILLHSKIHYFCAKGVVLFGQAYECFLEERYEEAFVLFGLSAECFDFVNDEMRNAEYGVWENFYFNDAFADVKHTAYMVRKARSLVREKAEGYRHDLWYHKYCYEREDQGIYLLLVTDNHMTDEELYQVVKAKLIDDNEEAGS